MERSDLGLIKVVSKNSLGGTEESHASPQDCRCPGRDTNARLEVTTDPPSNTQLHGRWMQSVGTCVRRASEGRSLTEAKILLGTFFSFGEVHPIWKLFAPSRLRQLTPQIPVRGKALPRPAPIHPNGVDSKLSPSIREMHAVIAVRNFPDYRNIRIFIYLFRRRNLNSLHI
jgi:hypothetical protein